MKASKQNKKSEAPAQPSKATGPLPVLAVAIDLIDPSPLNRVVDDADELVPSIKKHGVQQPVKLRPVGDRYEIVYGERRFRAAKKAGLKEIPATVEELSPDEAHELRVLENAARKDPHPLQEAEAWERLLAARDAKGKPVHTPETIARLIGRSVQLVYARLKLTSLIPELRTAVYEGKLSVSAAFVVARSVPQALQAEAWGKLQAYAEESYDEDLNAGGQLTVEAVQDLVDENYTFAVANAPFPTNRKIGPRSACAKCPNRSSAQPNLFASAEDKTKDSCLDLICWREKTALHGEACAKEVTAAGGRVITGDEARKILGTGGWFYSSKWVDLDAQCMRDTEARTWRAVLGDLCPPPVLVCGTQGKPFFLAEKEQALELVAKNGLLPARPDDAREPGADDDLDHDETPSANAAPADPEEARRSARFEATVARTARQRMFAAVARSCEEAPVDDPRFIDLVLDTVFRGGYFNAVSEVAKRRVPKPPKDERAETTVLKLREELTPAARRALLLELAIARCAFATDGRVPDALQRALDAYGIDAVKLQQETRNELVQAREVTLKKAS